MKLLSYMEKYNTLTDLLISLQYNILYHIILHYNILYYITMYQIIILYYVILYYVTFYYIILYYIVIYTMDTTHFVLAQVESVVYNGICFMSSSLLAWSIYLEFIFVSGNNI